MAATFNINVILDNGKQASFEGIKFGQSYKEEKDGISLTVSADFPARVDSAPPAGSKITSIEYDLFTDMRNYHKVIIPESGRWYINMTQMVSFWKLRKESAINDVKMPLYIFTGQDTKTAMAFGVVGRNYETEFRPLEPKVGRALIVYMRRLSMRIKRGTEIYPVPESAKNADGSVTEYLYFKKQADNQGEPWLLTLREFGEFQKKIYKLPDVTVEDSMKPLWCSWTDWFSDDVTDEVIVQNVKEGVKLGITNYIIDDGWFGPGLDNDFDVTLNIGDWRPDPAKIKDMGKLVKDVKAAGGIPLIWCAPHAVAPGADCFEKRRPYLIKNSDNELLLTPNKFHSLCFMNPEAREIMADLCASFITEWDFEGAKYDLFNCIPNMRCENEDHEHDTDSMMHGLELTLELIDKKCRKLKKNYIVELKQNYGTPFLAQYGTMTRAGDTPYNTEGNFMRTLYVQGYSPYSVNDYQTITNEDSPEATGCIALKMIAAGIPSYSIDFSRLNDDNKAVIAHYNKWYLDNLADFHNYRVPLDGENNVFLINGKEKDHMLLVNDGGNFPVSRNTTILNATYKDDIFIKSDNKKDGKLTVYDCKGEKKEEISIKSGDWTCLSLPPGSRAELEF